MDYSIIIPVFNKADLTKRCLELLPSTTANAGSGEVIVVDNASSDHTAAVLAEFPWIKVIHNDTNLGFSGANNQAARVAKGEYLVLLNNDTEPWPGWLAAMLKTARESGVGAVGARLLYPDKTAQHAGVVVMGNPFGRPAMQPFHHNLLVPFDDVDTKRKQDFQIVTGACLVTPRALYEELGGLDELYWNGYEDVDYCLKVRKKGLRVAYEPTAVLYHFESQSGVQRFRKSAWNTDLLERRWYGSVRFDALEKNLERSLARFPARNLRAGLNSIIIKTPETDVVVHGAEPADGRKAFEASIRRNASPVGKIHWALGENTLEIAREAMRVRGLRCTAFVHGEAILEQSWLDELLRQVTSTPTAVASTYAPELELGENVAALAADGRCTLLSLSQIPQHFVLEPFDTLCGSIADLLLRLIPLGLGTRGAGKSLAAVPALPSDDAFLAKHGRALAELSDTRPQAVEEVLRALPQRDRGLVSIVTLSWNAPQYTKMALESIARYTSEPYEVIVVDNGSGPETLEMLAAINDPHVRVIYNATNRGFGGGNNDGIAQAAGDYIVVLNNDVYVTENWLDALLDPFKRMPGVGVTAPRSNKITGDQEVVDASYTDIDGMLAYARERSHRYAKRGYCTDRAIGFCLCIDRRVIEEIGGFDERFRMGNFEDDDLCIRVRAAGYEIYVCDDSFIHHFGSQSFIANSVDYAATMQENWARFSQKWGYPAAYPTNGYDPRRAIVKGFDRERHYAALPATTEPAARSAEPSPDVVFAAGVASEAQWTPVAEFVKRFIQAFYGRRDVALSIAAAGTPDAETIGKRVMRILDKLEISHDCSPDIAISDEDDLPVWRTSIAARLVVDVADLEDRSPSALRRIAESTYA